ncbi:MAG: hypothetical protein V4617_03460 [Gemmatimonadota bacterium]
MRTLIPSVGVLLLAAALAPQAAAQSAVSDSALKRAQQAAGSAKVLGTRLFGSDSLVVEVGDGSFTLRAFEEGEWRFGGRDDPARQVGREVADAARAGLPARSAVKLVVVNVLGIDGTRMRFPYEAIPARRP